MKRNNAAFYQKRKKKQQPVSDPLHGRQVSKSETPLRLTLHIVTLG